MFALDGELHIDDQQFQYIARISHGKDSMKMLDVIISRGLRLDRITTTDIWATETIRGEHPEMVKFKERADEYIWQKYRIEVEHLCAMKDGEKLPTKSCFTMYQSAKPKTRGGGTVSSKGQYLDFRPNGGRGASQLSRNVSKPRPQGFPAQIGSWCKKLKIDYIRISSQPQPKRKLVYQAQDEIFRKPHREGRYKYRGIHRNCGRRAETLRAT